MTALYSLTWVWNRVNPTDQTINENITRMTSEIMTVELDQSINMSQSIAMLTPDDYNTVTGYIDRLQYRPVVMSLYMSPEFVGSAQYSKNKYGSVDAIIEGLSTIVGQIIVTYLNSRVDDVITCKYDIGNGVVVDFYPYFNGYPIYSRTDERLPFLTDLVGFSLLSSDQLAPVALIKYRESFSDLSDDDIKIVKNMYLIRMGPHYTDIVDRFDHIIYNLARQGYMCLSGPSGRINDNDRPIYMEVASMWEGHVESVDPLIIRSTIDFNGSAQHWYENAVSNINNGSLPTYKITHNKSKSDRRIIAMVAIKAYGQLIELNPILTPFLPHVTVSSDGIFISAMFTCWADTHIYKQLVDNTDITGYTIIDVLGDKKTIGLYRWSIYKANPSIRSIATFDGDKTSIVCDGPVDTMIPSIASMEADLRSILQRCQRQMINDIDTMTVDQLMDVDLVDNNVCFSRQDHSDDIVTANYHHVIDGKIGTVEGYTYMRDPIPGIIGYYDTYYVPGIVRQYRRHLVPANKGVIATNNVLTDGKYIDLFGQITSVDLVVNKNDMIIPMAENTVIPLFDLCSTGDIYVQRGQNMVEFGLFINDLWMSGWLLPFWASALMRTHGKLSRRLHIDIDWLYYGGGCISDGRRLIDKLSTMY